MSSAPRLCLIEDDPIMGESLCDRFALEGFDFDWCQTAESALEHIGKAAYCAVISDVRLPDLAGDELFRRLLARGQRLPPWIFITAYGSIDRAVEALKLGARDYLTKPFDIDQLVEKTRLLAGERRAIPARSDRQSVLGVSQAMRRIEELLPRLAVHAGTVLITGESGVGKEHVAQLLHGLHPRLGRGPFVAVNCGALTETLLESELFGFERGAFTGANRARKGVFEQSEGGTLFLDEIGEMSPAMQVKLLRAIQDRRVMRVGGERSIAVDLRLICATNQDLKALVEQGRFREDLYYRVNVVQLRIPPLRERTEDILWHARQFVAEFCACEPGALKQFSPLTESALLRHHWPGNVRELKHCVERACILARDTIVQPWDLFDSEVGELSGAPDSGNGLSAYLRTCERDYIMRALKEHSWRVGETAEGLGISRKNLWEKMRKLEIPGGAG